MRVPMFDLHLQNSKIRNLAFEKFSEIFDSSAFILGKEVDNFEKSVANYLGVKYAIGMSSGTDAILAALMAIGIKPGDEVICPSFTFFATAGCVARLGTIPVFVDIDLQDFNISVEDIQKKISKKTKAIIPVHLFGQVANMEEIMDLAAKFDISVVEDCAQSFGAKRMNKHSGTFGRVGCFSFYPTKNLGGFGDSGLICTNNDELFEKLQIIRVHGMKPRYFHKIIGGNFRIDEIQAALLNLKLPHVDRYIDQRRKNAKYYLDALAGIDGIILPSETENNFHTWNQFTMRVLDEKRDSLIQFLNDREIGCSIYYPLPLDVQECFQSAATLGHKTLGHEITKNANVASREVLSLPIFPELTQDQLQFVCDTIIKFFDN